MYHCLFWAPHVLNFKSQCLRSNHTFLSFGSIISHSLLGWTKHFITLYIDTHPRTHTSTQVSTQGVWFSSSPLDRSIFNVFVLNQTKPVNQCCTISCSILGKDDSRPTGLRLITRLLHFTRVAWVFPFYQAFAHRCFALTNCSHWTQISMKWQQDEAALLLASRDSCHRPPIRIEQLPPLNVISVFFGAASPKSKCAQLSGGLC